MSSVDTAKGDTQITVKRHGSCKWFSLESGNPIICHSLTDSIIRCHDLWPILSYFCVVAVNHYGKYGKTRAEEDARRYLDEKEQLEKEKEVIRKSLLSLRSEKRAAKEELKKATGERIDLFKCLLVTCHVGCHNLCSIWRHLLTISSVMGAVHLSWYVLYMCASDKQQRALEQHLAQLEESCRQKEAERVDLELRLTEVKEKLKKSLTGGVLGAPVESNPTITVFWCFSLRLAWI